MSVAGGKEFQSERNSRGDTLCLARPGLLEIRAACDVNNCHLGDHTKEIDEKLECSGRAE